ncbi:MAG: sugar phosphate nucleotidyltransferase [Actinomycetota bacterium]|nr:sugar phosphate nucleotidyltransferase [Actinomycetota bacterium]
MSLEGLHAVIMAGGEGSRLRPLTSNVPKPMLPVANRPLMEHIVMLVRSHGITDVVATVQFLSSVVRNYFGDGSDLGVSLSYATEEMPLGTAGSVLAARDLLAGTFVVISGDALTDIDLTEVVAFHRKRGAAATLVLKRMEDPLEFGIVMTGADGQIERFLEKPTWGQVFTDTINTGIYVLEPDVLDLIPPDQPHDFSSELFPTMLDKGLPLFGFVSDAYWTDVGNSDAYLRAHADVLSAKVAIDMPGFELQPRVWVGEDVDVAPTARIVGPALIGDNCRIGAGAKVGPFAVLGSNTIVSDDAQVTGGAVVMDGSHMGPYSRVRGAVVGRGVTLGKGAALEEGAVLGDDVAVGAGAFIKARVKVYPARTVEAGAIVTQSVVQEKRAARSLFGARGVSGLINVGITPVVAVRLGMAYGTTLKRGSVVVTGRDASRAARTIKRAIVAGLNATGVTCHDLELVPLPLTRFTVSSEQASGGISVQTSASDPEVVEIRLFDPEGADLAEADQRKIERMFFREDYRMPGPNKLGELEFPPRALEQYTSGLLAAIDLERIRKNAPKVVVDYAYGPLSTIGPSVLGRLGCDVLSVNAFTDEHRPVLVSDQVDKLLGKLADHVVNSGSDMGVLLEPGGEVARLVDDSGRPVSHEQALLAFVRYESVLGAKAMALPVSVSRVCETVAAESGARVHWAPNSLPALMERASRPSIGFAGNGEGALIFPEFMPAPDALMTFCKTLEMIASVGRPLSGVIDDLPEVHVATRDVRTPWQSKGAVMREVAAFGAARPGAQLMLLDGVKTVEADRWALVIPYPDQPLCRVWAEAGTAEEAEQLADEYVALIGSTVAPAQGSTDHSDR